MDVVLDSLIKALLDEDCGDVGSLSSKLWRGARLYLISGKSRGERRSEDWFSAKMYC
jgi:hypothetical protein